MTEENAESAEDQEIPEEDAEYDNAFKESGEDQDNENAADESEEEGEEEGEKPDNKDEGDDEDEDEGDDKDKDESGSEDEGEDEGDDEEKKDLSKREIAEKAGDRIVEDILKPGDEGYKAPPGEKKPPAEGAKPQPWEYTEDEKKWLEDFPEAERISDKRAIRIIASLVEKGKILTPDMLNDIKANIGTLDNKLSLATFQNEMYRVMPDWMEVASSEEFETWKGKQSPGIRALSDSFDPEDALKLLDYYKEDIAKGKTKEFDEEKGEKAKKKDKILGHLSNKGKKGGGKKVADPDDFDSAWEEATKEI